MINKNNHFGKIYISALLGALGIVLGAFSAHGLEKLVENQIITLHHLNVFEKAVKYQMYHSIVLLVLSISNLIFQKNVFQKSYWMLFGGLILFSGSLYWIALQNLIHIAFPKFLFWITPLGGLLMIIGWIFIIIDTHSLKNKYLS